MLHHIDVSIISLRFRLIHNNIVTNGSVNGGEQQRNGFAGNLISKHFHHQKNSVHNRASSSSGSSSNSVRVGNEGHHISMAKTKDLASQFSKSIGISNFNNHHGHGVGYSSFSPQDYLNNPMFDSLNASRHRRYWPSSGGGGSGLSSSDRTITLRPLVTSTKRNVHKRLPLSDTCKVL